MNTGAHKTIPPDALMAAVFLPLLFLALFYLNLSDDQAAGLAAFSQIAGL